MLHPARNSDSCFMLAATIGAVSPLNAFHRPLSTGQEPVA